MGMFLGALDLTVNVALPAITTDLGSDMSSVQWIIIVYVGTMTGLQLVVGRLADGHGLKRFYLTGILIYSIAVLAIGLAESLESVLFLRVVQALGYALMITTGPALVTRLFPDEERGRGLGFMTSVGTLGMIAATLGGGYLIETLGWESIFLARFPIGLLAFVLAYAMLREHKSETPPRIDLLGACTLFVAIASIVLFVNAGGRYGWSTPWVLGLLFAGIGSTVAFIVTERREASPIVRLDVISLDVARALVAAFLMSFTTFINLFLLPYYVAEVVGAGAFALGILLMLPPVTSAVAAPVAGWLSDRHSPRWVATVALAWLTGTIFSFAWLGETSSVADVGWRLALFGVGLGAFQASNTTSVMGSMPPDALSTGAAMLSLFFGLGMVTSVGLMTLLFEAFRRSASMTHTSDAAFVYAFDQTYLVAATTLIIATLLSIPFPAQRFARKT